MGEKCFEMQQPRRPARSLLILCLVERDDKRCWVIARSWVTHSPGSRHVYLHLLSSLPIRYSIPQEHILGSVSVPIEEFSKKISKLPWNYVVVLLIPPKYYLRQKCWSNWQFSCFRPHPVWESLIFWSLNWWILLWSGQQLSLKYSPFSLKLKCFIRRP